MKSSRTRRKLFITCMIFMCVFLVLFIIGLQNVTDTAYFEAKAEAETREMQLLYNTYFDLRQYYENNLSMFTGTDYINDEISKMMSVINYSDEQKAKASMEKFAEEFSGYAFGMDIFIVDSSSIIHLHIKDYAPVIERTALSSQEGMKLIHACDVYDFLGVNGLYEDNHLYKSNHVMIKKTEQLNDVYVIGIPRYDEIFSYSDNQMVIYNRGGQEELRMNTEPLTDVVPADVISSGKNYIDYGSGKNHRIVCYFSNEDESGDYCLGVVRNMNLSFRYIIYSVMAVFFVLVSIGMWYWTEKITKPLEFFVHWINLIKDKKLTEEDEETEIPPNKENYLLQNNIMMFFSFCLVPIIIAGALQWYTENQILNNYVEDRFVESAQLHGYVLDTKFESWRAPVALLCKDQRIIKALEDNQKTDDIKIDEALIRYVYDYSNIMSDDSHRVTVYDTQGNVVVSSINNMQSDGYIKYRVNVNENFRWTFTDGLKQFNYYHKIYNREGEIIGYCKLEIKDSGLSPYGYYKSDLYSCYVYKYTDKIFNLLGSPSLTDEKVVNMIQSQDEYPLAKSMLLENTNINYFYIVKEKILFDKIWNKYVLSFMNVVFFLSILLIFAAGFLTRSTLNPIIHLSNALYKDSPQVPMSTLLLGKEEFDLIVNRIRTLSEQVDSYAREQKLLEAERLEHEKKRKDAEIMTLQTQINPHFMYNIFSSIAVLIKTGENDKATKMVMYTGNLMRMGLYRGHVMIPLKEEIDHINQYIKIQQIRYNNCMEVVININEDLMLLKVVKFILQPIIENAIEHNVGYLEDRRLKIEVDAFIRDKYLVISIADNGVGMDKERMQKLQHSIDNFDMSNHLGLANINERIKLNCGNDYGVMLGKNRENGLRVELILPVVVEKEE